jgi:hypothetical protein
LSKDITDGMSAARLSNRHKAILQQQSATPHRSVLLKAQLGYADRGKPTFPCEGKRPLTKHGFKDASTDPRRITAWRHRRPHANIGMPTGERSGVFVLDVDRSEALEDLEREHGKLPETLTAETPSGGCHLYLRHVEGITNSPGGLPAGIDVRGEGGYVLVPPSAGYSWENRAEIAEAPEWLVELVTERSPEARPERQETRPVAAGEVISEGRRNTTLTSICGRLHDGSRSEAELTAELLAIRDTRCENPDTFTDTEVVAIARWTYRKEPCKAEKPPEVEQLVRELEQAFWGMWGEDFKGLGGQSDRDLLRVCLECAERWGRHNDAGEIEFDRSEQEMALEAGISRPTVRSAAERLGEKIGLRRDTRNREKASHAGTWILPSPAQVLPTHTNASLSPVERDVDAVVKSCAAFRVVGLETPCFRHFGPVGKGRGGVLLALEAFGPMGAERLAQVLGVARPRDLRRRYLDPLVEDGRIELRGGVYGLPDDHVDRCEEARSRRYSTVRRRRVRSYSPEEGRYVTTVVEVGSERSERERDDASRRSYADQRELFLCRLALVSPEADEGCRALLNQMDEELETVGGVRDITHLREAEPVVGRESDAEIAAKREHPYGCECPECHYVKLKEGAA